MANEKRLIDANALKEGLKSLTGMFTDEIGFAVCLESVLWKADAQPTVDAVEVVHGRWQNWHYDPCEDCYVHTCSKCGGTNERIKPYCPNCGAKMDGDGNV